MSQVDSEFTAPIEKEKENGTHGDDTEVTRPAASGELSSEELSGDMDDELNINEDFSDEDFKSSISKPKNITGMGDISEDQMDVSIENSTNAFFVKKQLLEILLKLKNRRWIKSFRSPAHFVNCNNFSTPKTRNEVKERLVKNSQYFLSNYALLLIIMSVYSIISRPLLIIFFSLFFYFWLVVTKNEKIQITSSFSIGGRAKFILFYSLFACLGILVAGKIIIALLITFATIVFLHLIFHDSMTDTDENSYRELAFDAV